VTLFGRIGATPEGLVRDVLLPQKEHKQKDCSKIGQGIYALEKAALGP
jgi:hypothetical protein